MIVKEGKWYLSEDNWETIILMILGLYPFLKLSFISVLIMILTVYVIFFKTSYLIKNLKTYSLKPLLIITGWFIFMGLTLIYSTNKGQGLKEMIKGISFFIVPIAIIYGFNRIDYKKIKFFFYAITFSNIVFLIYLYYLALFAFNHFLYNFELNFFNFFKNLQIFSNYTSYAFLDYIRWSPKNPILDIHRTYFCFSFLICFVFWLDLFLLKAVNHKKKILALFFILFFGFLILYFFSIINSISLVILVFVFLFLFFRKASFIKKVSAIFLIMGVMVIVSFTNSTYLKSQMEKSNLYLKEFNLINSSENSEIKEGRIRLANVGFYLFKKQPIFGYGIGAVEEKQLQEYKKRGYKLEYNEKQNTHNYYLNLLLIGGIPLLILFGLFVRYLFVISVKNKNLLLFSFSLIMLLNLLTENFLSRIYGIFSFSLFLSVLINPSIIEYAKHQKKL